MNPTPLYKNIETLTGLNTVISFPIRDPYTDIPLSPTGRTFRTEIFSPSNVLKIVLSPMVTLGKISFSILPGDISFLVSTLPDSSLFPVRTIMKDTVSGVESLIHQGYLSCNLPIYNSESAPEQNQTTLPDGTIYPLSETTIVQNTWYALHSSFRFMISGIGSLTLDARDLTGNIYGNKAVFQSLLIDPVLWGPDLIGMNAFRFHQVSGSNTITYLP